MRRLHGIRIYITNRERMGDIYVVTARAHHGEALRQILEEDVPNHEPPVETRDAGISAAVPASTTVGAMGPFASSSAPDAREFAEAHAVREKLRQEAVGWGIKPSEVEHIVSHHPVGIARMMLWRARRTPAATRIEAAAD